jgi:hypothetical protein
VKLHIEQIGDYVPDGDEGGGWHILTRERESVGGGPFPTYDDAAKALRQIVDRPLSTECIFNSCGHLEAEHEVDDTEPTSTVCISCFHSRDNVQNEGAYHKFRRYDP